MKALNERRVYGGGSGGDGDVAVNDKESQETFIRGAWTADSRQQTAGSERLARGRGRGCAQFSRLANPTLSSLAGPAKGDFPLPSPP